MYELDFSDVSIFARRPDDVDIHKHVSPFDV